jgi:hypothetical protein
MRHPHDPADPEAALDPTRQFRTERVNSPRRKAKSAGL